MNYRLHWEDFPKHKNHENTDAWRYRIWQGTRLVLDIARENDVCAQ